jgi:hypothetical protein
MPFEDVAEVTITDRDEHRRAIMRLELERLLRP